MRPKRFDNPVDCPAGPVFLEPRGFGKKVNANGSGRDMEVLYYSGYRAEETPSALVAGGRRFPVEKVLSRQRELDVETGRSFDTFRVQVAGRTVIVRKTESGESEILASSDLSFLDPPG